MIIYMEKMNEERFKQLFELYVSGKCTPQQRDEFFDLYAQFKADSSMESLLDELYNSIRQESRSGSFITYKGEIDLAGDRTGNTKVITGKSTRRIYAWRAAAAAGVLLLGLAGYWQMRAPLRSDPASNQQHPAQVAVLSATTTIRTGNHERKTIILSDSTTITLNSSSELRYPSRFDATQREVYLEGEAFFEVSQAATWPFIIHAPGNMQTTVLGTSFNIKAYPGRKQTVISVITGKVKISASNKELSTLVKGEELRIAISTGEASKRPLIEATNVLAWQSGNLVFNDETLTDILKDLQIYYGVNIRLKNEQLANLLLTTGFQKNTSIERVLENVTTLANANYTSDKDGYVVY